MITIGIDPVIVSLGSFSLRWYSLMIIVAMVVGVAWTWRALKRSGLGVDPEIAYTLAIWVIPGGLIGARLTHVLDQLNYYLVNPGSIIGGAGEAIYGAVLGGALFAWIGSRVHRYPFGQLVDLAAPALLLGQAIGRIGCVINGCCYGLPTSLPWGLVYTHPDSYALLSVPGHPSVVYELMWDLVVFGILLRLRGRLTPSGSLFFVYLSLYSLGRFAVDFTRAGAGGLAGLHQAQVIALLVMAVVIPILVYRVRWIKPSATSNTAA